MSSEFNDIDEAPKTGGVMSFCEKLSYSIFFSGQNIIYFLVAAFFQVSLLKINISAEMISLILLLPKIYDAINDPLVGIMVDKMKFKSGKYLPWIRFGAIAVPATTVLMFVIPDSLPSWAKILWAFVTFFIWSTVYSIADTPAFAITTSTTSDNLERASIQSYARLFANVGIASSMLIVPLLYGNIGFTLTSIIMCVPSFLLMLPICCNVKERLESQDDNPPSLKEIFLQLKQNKFILIAMGSIFCNFLFNTFNTCSAMFCQYVWGNEMLATLLSGASLLPSVFVAPLVECFLKKFDKVTIFNCSIIGSAVFGLIFIFIDKMNKVPIIILMFLRGIVMAPFTILLFQFTPDCVEYGTYVTGVRAEGASFSVQTFMVNAVSAIASALVMFIIGKLGFQDSLGSDQPSAAATALYGFVTWVPAIGNILQFLVIFFLL